MPNDYIINPDDVKQYLSTLQADQEAGLVGDIGSCLIAHALRHKYDRLFYVGTAGYWLADGPSDKIIEMTGEMREIRRQFDYSRGHVPYSPFSRTRSEVESLIPSLKGDN